MVKYISATGATTSEQVREIARQIRGQTNPIPILGFLACTKTLDGKKPRKTPERYVGSVKDLRALLVTAKKSGGVRTAVHYSPLSSQEAKQISFVDQISRRLEVFAQNGLCNLLQINADLLSSKKGKKNLYVDQLSFISGEFPRLKYIFPIQGKHQKWESEGLTDKLGAYDLSKVEYVLLDCSGGRGVSFDLEQTARVYETIKGTFPYLHVSIAGGLSAENVSQRRRDLTQRLGTDDYSLDAEGSFFDGESFDTGSVVDFLRFS